jgi:hypothetical protein
MTETTQRDTGRSGMADEPIVERINMLAREEEDLWKKASDGGSLDTGAKQRLDAISVELDRCYDLLRQRQARREFGLDPEEAKVRDADTVEHYEQ